MVASYLILFYKRQYLRNYSLFENSKSNFIDGWTSLICCLNFISSSVALIHMKNIIYESQVKFRQCSDKRVYVSFFKDTHKYICVACCTFVSMAKPLICRYSWQLKAKWTNVKTQRINVEIILVPIFFLFKVASITCLEYLYIGNVHPWLQGCCCQNFFPCCWPSVWNLWSL